MSEYDRYGFPRDLTQLFSLPYPSLPPEARGHNVWAAERLLPDSTLSAGPDTHVVLRQPQTPDPEPPRRPREVGHLIKDECREIRVLISTLGLKKKERLVATAGANHGKPVHATKIFPLPRDGPGKPPRPWRKGEAEEMLDGACRRMRPKFRPHHWSMRMGQGGYLIIERTS